MTASNSYHQNRPLNPVHAILLGFPPALFTAVLVGDIADRSSDGRPWAGLAVWLIVGGLIAGGLVLSWVFIGLIRAGATRLRRSVFYLAVLFGMSVLGLVNAFVHADGSGAGASTRIGLSAVAWGLALVAAWTGYLGVPRGKNE